MAITAHPRSRTAFAVLAVAALVLAGCASDPADVEDRSIGESPSLQAPPPVRASTLGGSYRVVKGDTLYSIAFKRGLDYRDVRVDADGSLWIASNEALFHHRPDTQSTLPALRTAAIRCASRSSRKV